MHQRPPGMIISRNLSGSALAHAFADGRVLFAQVAPRACKITISEPAFEWPGDAIVNPRGLHAPRDFATALRRVIVAGRN